MDEKNFENFLDSLSDVISREEAILQKNSDEWQERCRECQKYKRRLQDVVPQDQQKLIEDFDEAKNLESCVEADIAMLAAVRLLIRTLQHLRLL